MTDPTERMKIDQVVTGRIIRVHYEHYNLRLTTKSTDLQDEDGLYKVKDDDFTDNVKRLRLENDFKGKCETGKAKAQYIKVIYL